MKARFDQLSNDLFWDVCVSNPFEIIKWSGYNDSYWWTRVAVTDQFQIRTAKDGRRFRLNPDTGDVTEITTPPQ